jgi:hypothetical protein
MPDPNFIILYVDSPVASTGFYADLLGKSPIESSPTFAMFVLESGVRLGLWSKHTVEPAADPVGGKADSAIGGGGELVFSVTGNDAVRALHADWVRRGLTIAQAPTDMDFGYTFVALDPDRHRLRVYARSAS